MAFSNQLLLFFFVERCLYRCVNDRVHSEQSLSLLPSTQTHLHRFSWVSLAMKYEENIFQWNAHGQRVTGRVSSFRFTGQTKLQPKIYVQRKKHPWKSFLVFVASFFKEILFTLILRAHLFNLLLIFSDSYSNPLGTCIVFMVYLRA